MLRGCGALCEATRVFLWTDETGSVPLFYARDRSGALLFSTRAKLIVDRVASTRRFAIGDGERPLPQRTGTVFVGVKRVDAGTVLEFTRTAGRWQERAVHRYYDLPRPLSDRSDTARDAVVRTLDQSVRRALADLSEVHVTLSGGVDSSAVAALAVCALGSRVRTITIGSPYGDEFAQAADVARLLGTEHVERVMDADALSDMLPGLVCALETWDPATLQIAAPAAFAYASMAARLPVVLTGYGADLVFAGLADPTMNEVALERAVEDQVRLTARTNEFSPTLGDDHDVTVRYPYWSPQLLSLGMSLRGRLKVGGDFTKIVLRQAAESWLPHRVAWRPKRGIHEGSGMHRLFADCLGARTMHAQTDALRSIAFRVLIDRPLSTAALLAERQPEELGCASS
jgi:carbapenam-3-carboxylate synthase